jgi:two-component system, OmpR family, phosphate regulon response regulator PhoB
MAYRPPFSIPDKFHLPLLTDLGSSLMQIAKGRVLCVDDDHETQELMTSLLEQDGYEVLQAKNLTQGLRLATANRLDLILLDWVFEDGTGIDLCRMLRIQDASAPILFYSDQANRSDIEAALRAGAQGFLVKPVDFEDLVQNVSRIVGSGSGDSLDGLAQ